MNQSLNSSITMYPSPIPEIQGAEKSADMMAPGQLLYTTASSPQTSTLHPSPVAQIPQNIQQSFAGDAALGLQFQMSMYAQCAQGNHQVERKYGPCGIITGAILFPIGLIALLFDMQKICSRCGAHIV